MHTTDAGNGTGPDYEVIIIGAGVAGIYKKVNKDGSVEFTDKK